MSLSGHYWTLAPTIMERLRSQAAPPSQPWSTQLDDGHGRMLKLGGALRQRDDSDAIVVVVHGLGGAIESNYCIRAAHAIEARGLSCLRLALRGADRNGEDFYHAGLVADVEAALASPELARYRRLYVLGFSLGGHVSLHAALLRTDPRLSGVAAVGAPLGLAQSAAVIDRPLLWVYRNHILSGLKEIYAAVAAKRAVPTPLERVLQIKSIREWDALTVVPRYGFSSVDDYYARMSIGPRLSSLLCPALLLQSTHDPMVPPASYAAYLAQPHAALTVRLIDHGGHVGFPAHVGLEQQVLDWFETL